MLPTYTSSPAHSLLRQGFARFPDDTALLALRGAA